MLSTELARSAELLRDEIRRGAAGPRAVRAALDAVPATERDGWVDHLFLIESVLPDGPELPPACVPYLPCAVASLLSAIDSSGLGEGDVFVDLGSGIGRAALLAHVLTGARAIGVEIQSPLLERARELAAHVGAGRVSFVRGDAADVPGEAGSGSVFFLYCPFGADRVERTLSRLETIAGDRALRVCTVDLVLPARRWLVPTSWHDGGVVTYRTSSADR